MDGWSHCPPLVVAPTSFLHGEQALDRAKHEIRELRGLIQGTQGRHGARCDESNMKTQPGVKRWLLEQPPPTTTTTTLPPILAPPESNSGSTTPRAAPGNLAGWSVLTVRGVSLVRWSWRWRSAVLWMPSRTVLST